MAQGRRRTREKDSDDEFDLPARTPQEASKDIEDKPEDILARIVEESLDFSDDKSEAVESFYNRYKETFKKQETRRRTPEPGNILHVLAKVRIQPGLSPSYWTKEKLTQFLRWILGRHWALLESKIEESEWFPLHTAFRNENHAFIEAIIKFEGLKNAKAVFSQEKKARNYVQVAILAESPLLPVIAKKCAELTLPVWNGNPKAIGKGSETPLHIAVRRVLPVVAKLLSNYLLAKPGTQYYSPIAELYSKWKLECATEQGNKNYNASLTTTTQQHDPSTPGFTATPLNDMEPKPIDNKLPINIPRECVAQLLLRLIKYQQSQKSMSQVDVVKLFISLSETSLESQSVTTKKEAGETPYQERLARLEDAWEDINMALQGDKITVNNSGLGDEDALQMVINDDPIADTIRYHCLRHFDRDKIARCLYKPGGDLLTERHIDFDLAGLRNPAISNAFLKRLAKHLRFESILKYVALPKLELEDYSTDTEERRDNSQRVSSQRLTDLRAVFQWLRDNNVRRILKVTVVDYGSPCHSDAVIENALQGFQVETWDWKKVDLCTDVISNSTPMARHVSLYSSCNNAVLMGWASSDGLANREKFPKGQEGDRRAIYIDEFVRKIQAIPIPESDGKNITVEHHLDDGKISFAADFKNNEISEQQ
ncbi:hypothetical protein O1611_g2982 [Lasiodiplodia mahajangana]|uniref:Uncharacterized protein n=1 Tax=Lasiodiplodia mahajangana TaxID=1108764 RepID=A0ACC2JTS0_9PEZI|nr:hypothetical protein O1611_g2982 [Lasiodiplodia mahajangana]